MASAYVRGSRVYLRIIGIDGTWETVSSNARNVTEGRRLAIELQRKNERIRLGIDKPEDEDDGTAFGELVTWWLDNRCPAASRKTTGFFLEKHVVNAAIGALPAK